MVILIYRRPKLQNKTEISLETKLALMTVHLLEALLAFRMVVSQMDGRMSLKMLIAQTPLLSRHLCQAILIGQNNLT